MRLYSARRAIAPWLCVVLMVVCAPLTSWAQVAPEADTAPPSSTPGASLLAGVGAVIGSVAYAPFKALIMCPVGALASGVTYAATGGKPEPATYVLRLGCTGTYFIAPAMVQGQEVFRAYSER